MKRQETINMMDDEWDLRTRHSHPQHILVKGNEGRAGVTERIPFTACVVDTYKAWDNIPVLQQGSSK